MLDRVMNEMNDFINKQSISVVINERKVRIDRYNSNDVIIYNDKTGKWRQTKIIYKDQNCGRKMLLVYINYKTYSLARVVYKAFNKDYDIESRSKTNRIYHKNSNPYDNSIGNLRTGAKQE